MPEEITTGGRMIFVAAPYSVSVRARWRLEVILTGKPELYPDSVYVMIVAAESREDRLLIAPHVRRYYLFDMVPFDPAFYPRAGTYVVTVSVHPVLGFDFVGNVYVDEAILEDHAIVRYTHALMASESQSLNAELSRRSH